MTPGQRRRRICMVVHGPYPVGEPRVVRQSAAAVDAGYQVEVVAMRRQGERPVEVVEGVRVRRLPVSHRRGIGPVRLLLEYVGFALLATATVAARATRGRFDVVQVHAPPDFLLVSAVAPRVLGSRVLLDIHDPSPEMLTMRFSHAPARSAAIILRWIERLAGAFADEIVTVHEPYRRELIARGATPDKVTVVMNSVDERLLPRPKPPSMRPFRVVYHGTVTPSYGVQLLVEAAARILGHTPDLEVEIIGEGDAVPGLLEQASRLALSRHVTIDGTHVSHREALERINGASVGVIPNLPSPLNRFALSSKLLEYVALGIPVVAAGLPTILEYFSDDEIQTFEPGNAESLAHALLAVYRDRDSAAARAVRAGHRYDAYRWQTNARTYLSVLDRLSSPAPDPPGRDTRGDKEL